MIEASSLYTVTPEQAQENLLMELAAELGYATRSSCSLLSLYLHIFFLDFLILRA